MISRAIFCILIFTFLADIKVEGGEIPNGQGRVQVECGRLHTTDGQRVLPSGSSHSAGVGKRYRVCKPCQESFMGSRGKRIKKVHSHGHKFHRVSQQRKKKGCKYKSSSDEENIIEIITKKIGSAFILEHYIKRMGVVSIIDRMVSSTKESSYQPRTDGSWADDIFIE